MALAFFSKTVFYGFWYNQGSGINLFQVKKKERIFLSLFFCLSKLEGNFFSSQNTPIFLHISKNIFNVSLIKDMENCYLSMFSSCIWKKFLYYWLKINDFCWSELFLILWEYTSSFVMINDLFPWKFAKKVLKS